MVRWSEYRTMIDNVNVAACESAGCDIDGTLCAIGSSEIKNDLPSVSSVDKVARN